MFDLEKPKWIIQDGELRMGRVVNHSNLAILNHHGTIASDKVAIQFGSIAVLETTKFFSKHTVECICDHSHYNVKVYLD